MASSEDSSSKEPQLIPQLQTVLLDLIAHPYPTLPTPPTIKSKKRASVAVVIRINPNYSHWPPQPPTAVADATAAQILPNDGSAESVRSVADTLNALFSQEWVRHGDPEILFIKRSARQGDRWASHVALPGGRRDPEDKDDQAAAIREAMEEVGLDLTQNALAVGNLPQRVVTMDWGKVPLMVLCPYVFILTSPNIPPLRLQPSEVASTHWVSIRPLLSPSQRTYEYQDISNRLTRAAMGLRPWFFRAMFGQMLFAAIHLIPSESVYCTSLSYFLPSDPKGRLPQLKSAASSLWSGPLIQKSPVTDSSLLLWGLTLGVIADFLELIPPHQALELWAYPTFTPWDVRFTMWAMSYSFRKQKAEEMAAMHSSKPEVIDEGLESSEEPASTESGIRRVQIMNGASGINTLLQGYYGILRKAVVVALVGRCTTVAAVAAIGFIQYKKKIAG